MIEAHTNTIYHFISVCPQSGYAEDRHPISKADWAKDMETAHLLSSAEYLQIHADVSRQSGEFSN
jgi:hypothetical protein